MILRAKDIPSRQTRPGVIGKEPKLGSRVNFSEWSFAKGIEVLPHTHNNEWGTMLSEARRYMELVPLAMLVPGAAIFLTTLGMTLAGDGLRMAFDRAAKPR